jgi:hypothetical protein
MEWGTRVVPRLRRADAAHPRVDAHRYLHDSEINYVGKNEAELTSGHRHEGRALSRASARPDRRRFAGMLKLRFARRAKLLGVPLRNRCDRGRTHRPSGDGVWRDRRLPRRRGLPLSDSRRRKVARSTSEQAPRRAGAAGLSAAQAPLTTPPTSLMIWSAVATQSDRNQGSRDVGVACSITCLDTRHCN